LLKQVTTVTGWFEDLALQGAQNIATLADGRPLVTLNDRACYVAGGLDDAAWLRLMESRALAAGLEPQRLPADLRVSRIGAFSMAFNFSDTAIDWSPVGSTSEPVLGEPSVAARGLSIWHLV
jgi:beta-galactosidase